MLLVCQLETSPVYLNVDISIFSAVLLVKVCWIGKWKVEHLEVLCHVYLGFACRSKNGKMEMAEK